MKKPSPAARNWKASAPAVDLVEDADQHAGAHAAGRAEPATLVREELDVVSGDLEHVTRGIENRESTCRRQIFERDPPIELGRVYADAGRPADLHRYGIGRPAVFQHLPDGDPEWIFIETGPLAIARDRQDLAAG